MPDPGVKVLYYYTEGKEDNVVQLVAPHLGPHVVLKRRHTMVGDLDGATCLIFGKASVDELKALGAFPKVPGIGLLRKEHYPYNGGVLFPTWGVGLIYRDWAKKVDIEWDVRKAIRYLCTGNTALSPPKHYGFTESFDSLVKYVTKKYQETGDKVLLSMDLETYGLDPFRSDRWIVSISFTHTSGHAWVATFTEERQPKPTSDSLWYAIRFLVTTDKVKLCGANLKYDMVWMVEKWDIWCINQTFDTTLVGSLLDENRSNSLNTHAKIYTPIGGYDDDFNKKYNKGNMPGNLVKSKTDFLNYSGGDTDACYRVTLKQRRLLTKDKRLTTFYTKLLQPASVAFAKMEHRGIVVDLERYKELETELVLRAHNLEKEMLQFCSGRLQAKHYHAGVEFSRSAFLQDLLFSPLGFKLKPKLTTPKGDKPAVSWEHLMMFKEHKVAGPFIALLKEYKATRKTLDTYVTGFLKFLREDGRFHPTYMLFRGDYEGEDSGTVTGRSSAKDPAIQTLPKHTIWTKKLREVYVPPPGYAILLLDYSQGELRITAVVAQEPEMLKAYHAGYDMHSVTAAEINGFTYEEFMKQPAEWREEKRSGGKAGNFGLIYGMQAPGFVEYARTTYGVHLTLEESQQFRESFFDKYARLLPWHGEAIAQAQLHKEIRNPFGRIRHLPLIHSPIQETRAKSERQSINSPIQSALSDMTMLAMVQLNAYFPNLWIWSMTHDSLSFYVPEDKVEHWAKAISEIMSNLPLGQFGWHPELDFPVDAEASTDNYASMKKLKFIT